MIRQKKIASVVGTRPQFIKHVILEKSLVNHFEVSLVHTLQHYDSSLNEVILEDLQITGHQYLPTVNGAGGDTRMERMIEAVTLHLEKDRPNAVIVYGDTDTTLAAALAADKLQLPLVHIEAGERSFNDLMPEEYNRVLTDRLSFILCCSSQKSADNLQQEKISKNVFYTGDVMKDLLLATEKRFDTSPLSHPYYYATVHRNYTQADKIKLESILTSLNELEHRVVFSLHPSTQKKIEEYGVALDKFDNISFIAPVAYSSSVQFQKFAVAVITDSGGMQKEAYWLKTPCVTLRPETEWTETLENGWNQLYYEGSDLAQRLKQKPGAHNPFLYGEGKASDTISVLLSQLL